MVNDGVCYLDASALVKLVVAEPETPALRRLLQRYPRRASSRLTGVEVARALARLEIGTNGALARLFADLHLLDVGEQILVDAARLAPTTLCTLDAIHLASALALGRDLTAMVTYDRRLADAAREAGLQVASPS